MTSARDTAQQDEQDRWDDQTIESILSILANDLSGLILSQDVDGRLVGLIVDGGGR